MTATVVFLVLIALIVLGLQHNHARQRYHRDALAGSGTATDRDAERVVIDLAAAGGEVTFAAAHGCGPALARFDHADHAYALRGFRCARTLRSVNAAARTPSTEDVGAGCGAGRQLPAAAACDTHA
jgi:hypothetical protein